MFEKEAHEFQKQIQQEYLDLGKNGAYPPLWERIGELWGKGAEFGYNKANEWHYVKDGDVPKKSISVLAYFKGEDVSLEECLYIPDEGFKHPIFSEWYEPTAWIEIEKILPKEFEKC